MEQDYTVSSTDALSYCGRCGGPLEARVLKPSEPARLVCTACGYVHYVDPKVAVGTIIADERGHVVLVRRAIHPGYGKWVFPGGFIDRGETVEAAALREAREECGLHVELGPLVDIYSYPGVAVIVIVYSAMVVGGALACDDESLEARFFHADEIPWDELAFQSTREALTAFLRSG
jgi:ADP-ribose pyrophosphatase YjhB (NUDIX family)